MTTDPTTVDDPTAVRHELTVVMPVYNEADGLADCVASWRHALDGLGIEHRILVLDDGSTDATAEVLAALADDRRIEAVSKPNEGHGPTVLRGYADAVTDSDWVFQVDSDDEIPADAFAAVWAARTGHDAVFGYRTGREQPVDRRIISRVAAVSVRRLFGSHVRDVNVPYRLLRAEALAPVLDAIPGDTFAPNLVVSGLLGRDRATFTEVPVPHTPRRTGQVSIAGLGAVRAAARSFVQTLQLAWRVRRSHRAPASQ
jgi:dolichol-phosphate mannosyltransferase